MKLKLQFWSKLGNEANYISDYPKLIQKITVISNFVKNISKTDKNYFLKLEYTEWKFLMILNFALGLLNTTW